MYIVHRGRRRGERERAHMEATLARDQTVIGFNLTQHKTNQKKL